MNHSKHQTSLKNTWHLSCNKRFQRAQTPPRQTQTAWLFYQSATRLSSKLTEQINPFDLTEQESYRGLKRGWQEETWTIRSRHNSLLNLFLLELQTFCFAKTPNRPSVRVNPRSHPADLPPIFWSHHALTLERWASTSISINVALLTHISMK